MTAGPGADPAHDPLLLLFGDLYACGRRACDVLLGAARSHLPGTVFTIEGMSGLRFLLEPGTATMHTAGLPVGPSVDSLDAHDRCIAEATAAGESLQDPASWLEALAWTDGPSMPQVRTATAAVTYTGGGDDGLGEAGVAYPVAYLQRTYSPEAYALYAVATSNLGREVLGLLGAARLPAPQRVEVSDPFPPARAWLEKRDLTWLTAEHPVSDLLGTYLRMFPAWLQDHRDLVDLLGGLDRVLPAVAAAHLS